MGAHVFYRGNTHRVEVVGLRQATGVDTQSYVNDAVCGVTLVDAATGAELSGQSWPLEVAYESGSNGNYSGITQALSLSHGQRLKALVTAVSAGAEGYWELPVIVKTRT